MVYRGPIRVTDFKANSNYLLSVTLMFTQNYL